MYCLGYSGRIKVISDQDGIEVSGFLHVLHLKDTGKTIFRYQVEIIYEHYKKEKRSAKSTIQVRVLSK